MWCSGGLKGFDICVVSGRLKRFEVVINANARCILLSYQSMDS